MWEGFFWSSCSLQRSVCCVGGFLRVSRLNVRVLYSLRPARQRRNTTLAQLTFIFHEQFKQKKLFDRETQSCRLSFENCSIVVMRCASLRAYYTLFQARTRPRVVCHPRAWTTDWAVEILRSNLNSNRDSVFRNRASFSFDSDFVGILHLPTTELFLSGVFLQ